MWKLDPEWLKQKRSRQARTESARRWTETVAIICAAAVGIVTIILSSLDAAEQRKILREQQRQIQEQLDYQKSSFQLDERAWLAISGAVRATGGKRPAATTFNIVVKNVGKTAAYGVAVLSAGTHTSIKPLADANATYVSTAILASLFFGADMSKKLLASLPTVLATNKDAIAELPLPKVLPPGSEIVVPVPIQSGKLAIASQKLEAKIVYNDVFQKSHWLSFCYEVENVELGMRPCKEGNDQDRVSFNSVAAH